MIRMKRKITDEEKATLDQITRYTPTHMPCHCAETELVPALMRIAARGGRQTGSQSIHVFSAGIEDGSCFVRSTTEITRIARRSLEEID
jgi:hypothetical protein